MSAGSLQQALESLHLLRPQWLFALLLLPPLLLWWRRRARNLSAWRHWVDPHLLAHLLQGAVDSRRRWGMAVAAVAYVLAVIALAGPSWSQSSQPLWESRSPLVIVLDLSSASRAGDLQPSRLAQARAKISTLLQRRNGGPVGLVVYAGDAFTVAPITDDAANVALFLEALDPEVMPVDGERADRGIAHAAQLLLRSGARGGDILLLTGTASPAAREAAQAAADDGHRVSVLGLGTPSGAPYPTGDGELATARLEPAALASLARAGNGRYALLTIDDDDLRALGVLAPRSESQSAQDLRTGLTWQDQGYWLLPPLMFLALLAFRRRSGVAAVLALALLLPCVPAHAQDLWRRPDQAAHARLEQGNDAYRRGDFAQAAQQYAALDAADAHYNRGNALAKAGQYRDAIDAYDQALTRSPGMPDALANKRAVEALLKRQSPASGSNAGRGKGQSGSQAARPDSSAGAQPTAPADGSGAGAQRAPQPQAPSAPSKSDASSSASRQAARKPDPPQSQSDADRAQRERMERALRQARRKGETVKREQAPVETPQQREQRLANDAWLRRVPDEPGALLRTKFRLEYERRLAQGREP